MQSASWMPYGWISHCMQIEKNVTVNLKAEVGLMSNQLDLKHIPHMWYVHQLYRCC